MAWRHHMRFGNSDGLKTSHATGQLDIWYAKPPPAVSLYVRRSHAKAHSTHDEAMPSYSNRPRKKWRQSTFGLWKYFEIFRLTENMRLKSVRRSNRKAKCGRICRMDITIQTCSKTIVTVNFSKKEQSYTWTLCARQQWITTLMENMCATEFLSNMIFPGIPIHELKLKVGLQVMLL